MDQFDRTIALFQVADLDHFADFIHNKLLPHPDVSQVRSEIVLRTLKS